MGLQFIYIHNELKNSLKFTEVRIIEQRTKTQELMTDSRLRALLGLHVILLKAAHKRALMCYSTNHKQL